LETDLFKNPIEAYITTGLSAQAVSVQENIIDSAKLKRLFPQVKLSGKVKVDSVVKMDKKGIYDLKLAIQSKDFALPAQSIMGFKLPTLKMNSLFLKAEMNKKNNIKVHDFILGDTDSPIRASFKGDIALNQRFMAASKLNLKGEVAFAQHFLEKFAIIKLFMNKFTKKDEFYQLQLTGPLNRPQAVSPKK
jgi:type II secretion system protein N